MQKIRNIKFNFIYANKPESEVLLNSVYSRIFQKAYENLTKKDIKTPIIKPNNDYGTD